MFKKIISVTLVLVFLFAFIPSSTVAVNINEDVGIFSPIFENMETTTNMAVINSQLTGAGSGVALSKDAAEGKFSWQVTTTTQMTNPYAQYTLVNSEQFNIAEFSSIKIWVKPGSGASWISFYINNALITCDKDGDGQFEVGSDLTSGKWTQLTLDLLKTDSSISTGDDLVVRSNDNSVWSFDEVKAQGTKSTNIDLSTMFDSSTTLNNGSLQFNKTGDGTAYVTTPTSLVSNRSTSMGKEFYKQTDFAGGTFVNCTGQTDGSIVGYTTIPCTGGNEISNGVIMSVPPVYAFDSSIKTSISTYSGPVSYGYYIGYDYGTSKAVNGVGLYIDIAGGVTSAYLQYFNGSSWVSIGTVPITTASKYQYFWFESTVSASKWRLLPATGTADGWYVNELQFINVSNTWSYTSSSIDISTSKTFSQGVIVCSANPGTSISVQTALSLDGGTTWQNWMALNKDGTISGINKTTNLQNARIKYMLSGIKSVDASIPVVNSVNLLLSGNDNSTTSLSGNLQRININSNLVDINGNTAQTFSTAKVSSVQGKDICAFSGNGNIVYYKSGGNLYYLDINSGTTATISTQFTTIISVKANYDGTVAAIYGQKSNTYNLIKYDSKQSTNLIYLINGGSGTSTNNTVYDIQDNGGIIFG